MDPLSILTSAFAISKVLWNCSSALYVFIEDVSAADETISALYNETIALRSSLEGIAKILQTQSVRKYDQLPLWEDMGARLADCEKTVLAFHQKLEKIRPEEENGTKGPLRASIQVFKNISKAMISRL
jgi:hypothetical protein